MIRLTNKYSGAEIVRTRDPELLETLDAVLDVGGVYDPSRDRYDHQQKGFTEVFGHGFATKLSSAGLIYKHFGTEIIAKDLQVEEVHPDVQRLYLAIYKSFMEETYQRLMIERYGEDLNNHPPHDHELWLKSCGGRKKGRLIGASDADDPIFVLTGTPGIESGDGSSCGSRPIDVQVEKLQKTVVDMEEERAERKKEIEALEQANERERLERERIEKEFNDYRAETNKKFALFAHLEPPSPLNTRNMN